MIKFSGIEPEEVFKKAGVDESVQKQISDKIGQGFREPSVNQSTAQQTNLESKKSSAPVKGIDAMPSGEKRKLAELAQSLRGGGMGTQNESEKDDDSVTSKSSHASEILEQRNKIQKNGPSNIPG